MFLAIQQGYYVKAIESIENASDVNICDGEGKTALIRCTLIKDQNKAVGLMRALLAKGAKISMRDKEGLNALHYSCIGQLPLLVDVLLAALDCNVNVKCRRTGNTPLHFSVIAGSEDVTRRLVHHISRYRLNIDVKNRAGETALALAFKFSNTALAQLLISHGANIRLTANIDVPTTPSDQSNIAKPLEKRVKREPYQLKNSNRPSTAANFSFSSTKSSLSAKSSLKGSSLSLAPTFAKSKGRTSKSARSSLSTTKSWGPSKSLCSSSTTINKSVRGSITFVECDEHRRHVDEVVEVSWREIIPMIWTKYTQQNSASFRKPADLEQGEEVSRLIAEQANQDMLEELAVPNNAAAKRRNSSMAYLGPPISRRGSLFQAAKAPPTKFESMRSRRQSVAV